MKKRFNEDCLKYLSFFILMLLACYGNAQDDANNHPKPYMWAPDSPQFKQNFIDKKWPRLNKHYTNITQPISFTLGNFLGMIEYFETTYGQNFECLHVYIAEYSKSKKMMLIFAPAKAYPETDLGRYFSIPQNLPFNPSASQIGQFELKAETQKILRNNFVNGLIKSIKETVDAHDPDNWIADGAPSDTRCITYCKKDLLELVNEQKYDHTDFEKHKIDFSTDMRVSFAAFGDQGHPVTHKGKNRLFIEFDFIDKDTGEPIYLEKTNGFDQRGNPNPTCGDCLPHSAKETIKSLDNGTLCPPCENCPAGYSDCTTVNKANKKR